MLDAPQPLLPEIFALHGRWRARSPALVAPQRTLDWQSLDRSTNRIANALIGAGARHGDRVALLMSNCIEMAELIVGIMRAGCVAVPLNTAISADSAASMLADSGAVFVFATADHAARVGAVAGIARIEVVGEGASATAGWRAYADWLGGADAHPPTVPVSATDLCNIIYSSGTTGEPKGIVHSHGTRVAWAYDAALALRYHSGARTLLVTGLYSNITWAALLGTWLSGGTVVLRHVFDVADTLATIARERITHTAMVPVQYQRLLDHPQFHTTDRSSLQAIMSVGSSLPLATKAGLIETCRCDVIEVYGTTEGIITALDPEDAESHLSSVGKPLPGVDLLILDEHDRPLEAGEAGEIVGRSRFAMAGYWRRPEATAQATWIDEAGRAWLRTGDIGRLDEEGYLYILDRKKDLIISGGQNIYPADIEAVLMQHAAIAECAVIGVPSPVWGESPLALVIVKEAQAGDGEAIKHWLNERVGKQQRVAAVEIRDHLPRNPTGKLLKRELRAPYWPGA
ncbi:class I adenylate-forming enzyme family protein [Lysobacter sp. Hz 25]|uniref:class I adenylate-forming enzyme family protein n=1 Tax=Lysobacter sp. Hz 25 TaxID=3383698 RepID=UPI0038D51245